MAQKDIEIILLRQLAGHLATAAFIIDPSGSLLYYNEPAEKLLGRRYEETGEMPLEDWAGLWEPCELDGQPLAASALPLVVALGQRQPDLKEVRIRGLDGVERRLIISAFPIEGQAGRHLGAACLFWEVE
jgi:PAS domain-containing protein